MARRQRRATRPPRGGSHASARGAARAPRAVPGLERVDDFRWRIPRDATRGMRVDGLVFADDALIAPLRDDPALVQVADVATLPGIVGASLAMPDVHWGYGFPVGGVAAMDAREGVISPGGIGFDINCGVRLLRSDLGEADVRPRLAALADAFFAAVPSGVGSRLGRKLARQELEAVLVEGAGWAVDRGHGTADDLERTEERGRLAGADPDAVSARARERGADQLGTLGSGNHFLELQVVERIDDRAAAAAFGLEEGSVTIMVHCGSRGLGHQVCTDHVASMDAALPRFGIDLPDRQLACAPLGSAEAAAYLGAMAAAANFAWANRQLIVDHVRAAMARVLDASAASLGLRQVYDLSHNIAKMEDHLVDGHERRVCVHRKGATRAFPAGHPDVPAPYRPVGQPVLVPGDMGRASYVAVGAPGAMTESFGSSCHGAGRNLSRHAASRELRGVDVAGQLAAQGVLVRAERRDLLAEEASIAYKDVEAVIRTAQGAGLIRSVARLRPLAVVKG
ncbi:MAG TPA: RtcB family protein [Candidatus Limnocylindrales bacterium]|nr:RtcB family protein [Candidatus Limnocylindrales bacterium]